MVKKTLNLFGTEKTVNTMTQADLEAEEQRMAEYKSKMAELETEAMKKIAEEYGVPTNTMTDQALAGTLAQMLHDQKVELGIEKAEKAMLERKLDYMESRKLLNRTKVALDKAWAAGKTAGEYLARGCEAVVKVPVESAYYAAMGVGHVAENIGQGVSSAAKKAGQDMAAVAHGIGNGVSGFAQNVQNEFAMVANSAVAAANKRMITAKAKVDNIRNGVLTAIGKTTEAIKTGKEKVHDALLGLYQKGIQTNISISKAMEKLFTKNAQKLDQRAVDIEQASIGFERSWAGMKNSTSLLLGKGPTITDPTLITEPSTVAKAHSWLLRGEAAIQRRVAKFFHNDMERPLEVIKAAAEDRKYEGDKSYLTIAAPALRVKQALNGDAIETAEPNLIGFVMRNPETGKEESVSLARDKARHMDPCGDITKLEDGKWNVAITVPVSERTAEKISQLAEDGYVIAGIALDGFEQDIITAAVDTGYPALVRCDGEDLAVKSAEYLDFNELGTDLELIGKPGSAWGAVLDELDNMDADKFLDMAVDGPEENDMDAMEEENDLDLD